jgi:REG-2-like HAD superfamily hydrolase
VSPIALLLDAGGTLLSEEPSRETLYAQAATRRGLNVPPPAMRLCMHRAHAALPLILDGNYRYSRVWFEAFIADVFVRQLGLEASRLPALVEELFAVFADAANFRLLPGARELLDEARRRGWKLALVSNWSPALPGVLEGLGILTAFDQVLVSAIEGLEKPQPAIFERALERLNVPAHQALHVGNEPVQDVQGAQRCGIRALLLDARGEHAALGLASVKSLNEVIPWIENSR